MIKFALVSAFILISTIVRADVPPTVQEMSAFLSSHSVNPNCYAPQNHYTNLKVKLHTVWAARHFTVKEQQILSALIESMSAFKLNSVSEINFWFDVAPNASTEQVIRGLFLIENILGGLAPDLFLVSQQQCS